MNLYFKLKIFSLVLFYEKITFLFKYIKASVTDGNINDIRRFFKSNPVKIIEDISESNMLLIYSIVPSFLLKANKTIDMISNVEIIISQISWEDESSELLVKFFNCIKFIEVFIDTSDSAI